MQRNYKDEIASLRRDIQEFKKKIEELDKAYEHEVVVAASSPSYAWVFPFGTIAAVVVAGVYGDRAVKTKAELDATRQLLANKEAQLGKDVTLMSMFELANKSMDTIQDDIAKALPVIQKIQGIWQALGADLKAISAISKNDISEALPIIMDLGIDNAKQAWRKVGDEANAYRVNAFVIIQVADAPAA